MDDPRTGRQVGDHGTAEQAINFALDHSGCDPSAADTFLRAWREGSTDDWPDYYVWLEGQPA